MSGSFALPKLVAVSRCAQNQPGVVPFPRRPGWRAPPGPGIGGKRRRALICTFSQFVVAFPIICGKVGSMQRPCAQLGKDARPAAGQRRTLASVLPASAQRAGRAHGNKSAKKPPKPTQNRLLPAQASTSQYKSVQVNTTNEIFFPANGLKSLFGKFLFPCRPHPGPLPLARERENRRLPFGESRRWTGRTRLRTTRIERHLFLLPGGEGQDEGEPFTKTDLRPAFYRQKSAFDSKRQSR